MKHILSLILLPLTVGMQAQSLDYAWLNQPCGALLNCDSGCTACLLPATEGALLTGTAAVWHGIDACPHPITSGDNTVLTYGWPVVPDEEHYVSLSGIAFTPVHIDSIIIRHSALPDGPLRLLTRFGINANMPETVVSDVLVGSSNAETVISDLGCVQAGEGMVYGYFQILLQAYDGGLGAWSLDDISISASPCATTSINEVLSTGRNASRTGTFDALGKAVNPSSANGVYLSGGKVVVLR